MIPSHSTLDTPHSPVVILVRPQLGENIGAVARAMSNFGLSELRLVAPRDGWPNKRANETASGGEPIVQAATVYPDLPAAMHDVQLAYATTARSRDMEKRTIASPEAGTEIHAHATGGARIALVFGPERTGLINDDISWCDTLVTIPTAPENSSLNIAQSAVVMFYEWFKQTAHEIPHRAPPEVAPKQDWKGLFDQLEVYLDETNFFRVAEKKTIMWHNMKNMLMRGQFSEQEIRTLRGVLRILWEKRTVRKAETKKASGE